MSNAPAQDRNPQHDLPHEGPIKTPKQLVLAILFSFVVPVAAIIGLATYVTEQVKPGAGSDGLKPAAVAERVRPIGTVEVKDMSDPAAMKSGAQVYAAQCVACHGAGVAGAPKFGDAAAWGPRIPSGYDALLNSALHGKGNMGPQGGGDFSDYEIGRAVVYMANQGGAKFDEPKFTPPAAGAVADAGAAAASTAAATAPEAPASAATAAGTAQAVTAALAAASGTAGAAPAPAGPATTTVAAADAGAPPALYGQVCATCHAAGLAGAPKLGDKAGWAPRLAAGIDGLTASAIKGKNAMPPRGGSTASDADIKAVVAYMVTAAK